MKHLLTYLILNLTLICFTAAQQPLQKDFISFEVKKWHKSGAGVPVNLTFFVKGEVFKNNDDLETIRIEAYEDAEMTKQHIEIEASAEKGEHLEPGEYNFGDKEDFYDKYPMTMWYYEAKDAEFRHGTVFGEGAKAYLTITSIKNGRVSGTFSGSLEDETLSGMVITKIENGTFNLAYSIKK